MARRNFCTLAAALIAASPWAAPAALAHSSVDRATSGNLSKLVEDSNLILIGDVAKVEYRNLQVYEGSAPLPHVIVTYRIRSALRGKAPGDTFTMRFVGGPDGMGRFLSVSGVPQFQPGDQDVLFVNNNGSEACALVMCEYGRFRVSHEQVFNAEGEPVRAILKDTVVARGAPPAELMTFSYPAPKFDDLMKNPELRQMIKQQGLKLDDARKRYESEAPKTLTLTSRIPALEREAGSDASTQEGANPAGAGPATTKPGRVMERPSTTVLRPQAELPVATETTLPETAISLTEFVSYVKRLAETAKRQPVALQSIDPNATVKLRQLTLANPEKVPTIRLPSPTGPSDATERQRYEANGQNPVLGQ